MLPAMLRIQSLAGRKKTSFAPPAIASVAEKIMARPVRAIAIHCQSSSSFRPAATNDIIANNAAPQSIQRYGEAPGRNMAGQASGGASERWGVRAVGRLSGSAGEP